MLGHQLRALGVRTTITRFDNPLRPEGFDLVIVGPGPGDPRDATDPRMNTLRALTRDLLASTVPFLSICLGHQILATELGLEIVRRAVPNQGVQKLVNLFGQSELVGFYNTYAARAEHDFIPGTGQRKPVEISRNPQTGEVHFLRGAGFRSVQFHLESILTQHGPQILGDLLTSLLRDAGSTGVPGAPVERVASEVIPSSIGLRISAGRRPSPGPARRPCGPTGWDGWPGGARGRRTRASPRRPAPHSRTGRGGSDWLVETHTQRRPGIDNGPSVGVVARCRDERPFGSLAVHGLGGCWIVCRITRGPANPTRAPGSAKITSGSVAYEAATPP
jgi:anthranilate/para-aminobenzoate synthase component II